MTIPDGIAIQVSNMPEEHIKLMIISDLDILG